jgi:hypothetical protein
MTQLSRNLTVPVFPGGRCKRRKLTVPHLFHSKSSGLRVLFDATNQRLHKSLSGAARLSTEGPSIIVAPIARASQLVRYAAENAGAVKPRNSLKEYELCTQAEAKSMHY